ncbi:MAG: proline--tRNA ligase, partial [Anaerolineae bacterium]|nr:proline--tRNA ligase [Anaerolineae bacterium]
LEGVRVIADESVLSGSNLVAGANRPGYHYVNVNYPRDFQADTVADIAQARAGLACPRCGEILRESRGIEIGHLFKLGTRYSRAVGATFLDRDGEARPIVMGSYGIGAGRLMAAVVEQHHDEKGIIWPPAVAPFEVHLVSLGLD